MPRSMRSLQNSSASKAEMDKIRAEENGAFEVNSAEMEKGLKVSRWHSRCSTTTTQRQTKAHSSSDGASSGIIGLLEVCESDFSKGLAEMKAAEESAISTYETETKQNEIEKATARGEVQDQGGCWLGQVCC